MFSTLQRTLNIYNCYTISSPYLICTRTCVCIHFLLTIESAVQVGIKMDTEMLVTMDVLMLVTVELGHEELVAVGTGDNKELIINGEFREGVTLNIEDRHKYLEAIS